MNKFSNIVKNISYTLTSNFLSLFVSIIVSLVLPKVLGIEDYAFYQLYVFYVSYVGMLHFGWCDGIYLRYGGLEYKELDKNKIAGQLYSLLILQLCITILFFSIISLSNFNDISKKMVLIFSILNIIILNLRTFYMLILQTTNRMKEYSEIIMIDRGSFVLFVIVAMFLNYNSFTIYIIIDIFSKILSLIFAALKCSDITFNKKIKFSFIESKLNISSGINLMLANIASMLVIGIVRFGIQNHWDIETFGKISLTLSISNMLMVFVGAISLAIFPLIKRAKIDDFPSIYPKIRSMIMPFVLIILIFYFPLEMVLSKWLPQYKEALKYMVLVFPMIVFESKVLLLSNTFLKALRKERDIFKVNIFIAFCSIISTLFFVYYLDSLFWSMLSIVILLGMKSTMSEILVKKHIQIEILSDILLEISMVSIFIFFGWNYDKIIGFIVYLFSIIIYVFLKRKMIMDTLLMLKNENF